MEALRDLVGPGVVAVRPAVLLSLEELPDTTSVRVAEALGISRSQVTAAADRLVEQGLVWRGYPVRDGRQVMLNLTDEGRREKQAIRGRLRQL